MNEEIEPYEESKISRLEEEDDEEDLFDASNATISQLMQRKPTDD